MPGKSYKQEKRTGKLADFVSEAFGEWQMLRDEMREWAEQLEEKFSSTEKYQTVSDTADTLDNQADNEPEIPDSASDLEVSTVVYVKYGKERGSESRDTRNGNALSLVDAAIGTLEDKIAELEQERDSQDINEPGESERFDKLDEQITALEELRDNLTEVKDEFESLEFPGMYG